MEPRRALTLTTHLSPLTLTPITLTGLFVARAVTATPTLTPTLKPRRARTAGTSKLEW